MNERVSRILNKYAILKKTSKREVKKNYKKLPWYQRNQDLIEKKETNLKQKRLKKWAHLNII